MPKAPTSLTKARKSLVALLLVGIALAVSAPSALASRNQTVFFEAGKVLIEPHKREHAFQQLEHLGVHALRVELYWSYVAPASGSNKRPKFEATNPAAYNWTLYDWVLNKARN